MDIQEEKLPNYETYEAVDTVTLYGWLNAKANQGYKLHTVGHRHDQRLGYYAVMYLDKGNYEDVTNLADVSPSDVDQYLENGWEIASTSISTKFVRMIKRAP